jgi:hypothetical protein
VIRQLAIGRRLARRRSLAAHAAALSTLRRFDPGLCRRLRGALSTSTADAVLTAMAILSRAGLIILAVLAGRIACRSS